MECGNSQFHFTLLFCISLSVESAILINAKEIEWQTKKKLIMA